MSSSSTVAGIDVSKAKLDIYIHPLGIYKSFDNNIEAFEKIFYFLKQYNVEKVGLESTGGYEKLCAYALLTKGLDVYIIQAKWMRDYARSLGITVKTDKIDSNLIARYINNPDMRVTILTVNHNTSVKELFCRREQLVEIIKIQKTQKHQINNSSIIIQIDNLIKVLKNQIIDLEIQMIEMVKKTPELSQKYKLLISIPGIGNIVAISLLCYLPELGTLCSKQIAKLAGLAPLNWDSGKKQGRRFIQGGRLQVRKALYMAIISATRYNPYIKGFFNRLIQQGKKPFKIAATASMRKLLILANTLVKEGRIFCEQ